MGKFIAFMARNVWAQALAFIAGVFVVIGMVNDAISFFSIPWLPVWTPQALGVLLFYAAFQVVAFQVDKAVQEMRATAPAPAISEVPVSGLTARTGAPNLSLANAIKIVSESKWADEHRPTNDTVLQEMRDKLTLGKITAFGRSDPQGVIGPITRVYWTGYRLEPKTSCAVTDDGTVGYHDIQFDKTYVQLTWPKSRSGWA